MRVVHKQIFVNLPIEDMQRSQAFFRRLGFEFNAQFANDQGACMVVGENIFVMLLDDPFFKTFTAKPVCDATRATEVLTCLSCESRAEVDALVAKALAAGGRTPRAPQDHGFVYGHDFEELDGHLWEVACTDPHFHRSRLMQPNRSFRATRSIGASMMGISGSNCGAACTTHLA